MSTLIPHQFTMYEFTAEELVTAAVFTELQTQYLRTELARICIIKNNLAPAYENPELFIRTHEYYRGKAEAISELLNGSEDFRAEQVELLKQKMYSQNTDIQTFNPINQN